MSIVTDTLSNELKKDLQRNRDGQLSTRQWTELISQPLTTLLLLAVPIIILIGRLPMIRLYIILAIAAGLGITILLRAMRFARVKLHYRVLYVEKTHSRWKFWQKQSMVTKLGEPFVFHQQITSKLDLTPNQAIQVYYIDLFNRHILVSALPEKHPQANFANPTNRFTAHKGIIHQD